MDKIKKQIIPDVKDDPKILSCYLAGVLVGVSKGMDKKVELSRINIVRLIDKAIYEYKMAREAILDEINRKDQHIYTVSIINHLENCINSIVRVFNLYKNIKRNPAGPKMDSTSKKLVEAHEREIRNIRDVLEHIDKEIRSDSIKDGQSIALRLSKDYKFIEIAAYSMRLIDVVNTLKHFYEIGRIIAHHKNETLKYTLK